MAQRATSVVESTGPGQRTRAGVHAAETLGVALLLGVAGYAALFIAPTERTMGVIQRIFYFHVPSAWTGFVAFFITFVASIAYLRGRNPKWDRLAVSAAEIGVAFFTVVLITGPIWAKPVWGIWWTWDARLTSSFVLWLLFVCYMLLRTLGDEPCSNGLANHGRAAAIGLRYGCLPAGTCEAGRSFNSFHNIR